MAWSKDSRIVTYFQNSYVVNAGSKDGFMFSFWATAFYLVVMWLINKAVVWYVEPWLTLMLKWCLCHRLSFGHLPLTCIFWSLYFKKITHYVACLTSAPWLIQSTSYFWHMFIFPEAFSLDTILRGTPTATPCRTTPTPPTPMPATTNASSSATGGNLIAYYTYSLDEQRKPCNHLMYS